MNGHILASTTDTSCSSNPHHTRSNGVRQLDAPSQAQQSPVPQATAVFILSFTSVHAPPHAVTASSTSLPHIVIPRAGCWAHFLPCVRVISPRSLLIHVLSMTPFQFKVRAQPSLMCSAESCLCYSPLNPSLCVFCTASIHILYFCRYHPFKLLPLLHQSIAPYHLTLPGTSTVRWQMTISTCGSTSCAATDDEHVGGC